MSKQTELEEYGTLSENTDLLIDSHRYSKLAHLSGAIDWK